MRIRAGSIQSRIAVVWAAMAAAMLLLVGWLWRLQVGRGEEFRARLERQSTRRVRLPAMRGRIFDRNGVVLADNRPSYCIAIHLEELRQRGPWARTIDRADELLDRLSRILGLPRRVSREDIRRHMRRRLPLPLIAWRDLDDVAVARWAELGSNLPGVELFVDPVRYYPFGPLFCHVVGYVGRTMPSESAREFDYYLPEYEGRRGIEKRYDDWLKGCAGGKVVLVDASGFRFSDLVVKPAVNGHDLRLTLDANVQRVAAEALGDRPGAVVVMDPADGSLLALVSSPGFDPNRFVPGISVADWDALLQDPRKPLLNRAVAASYMPGSTIKPLVALAAERAGRADRETRYVCPGYLDLGQWRFHCWYRRGHGRLNLPEALRYSCNVYFFRLALSCGPEAILRELRAVGLGQPTGIDLDYELSGLVPDREWHRKRFGRSWSDGDTCNLAIGQGSLIVTPIQMAVVTAALANGGIVVRPHLLARPTEREEGPEQGQDYTVRRLGWTEKELSAVREGMREVVMARDGTGRRAAVPGVTMAGKTGTAQYGPRSDRRKYCWMIAYAPFEQPRYVVCVVVDNGESGGATAAPIVRTIMSALLRGEGKG